MLSGYLQLRGHHALSSRDALDNTAARVDWSYPVPIVAQLCWNAEIADFAWDNLSGCLMRQP